MSDVPLLTIHTDGASRGNPGPAAYAYVIARDGQPPIEEAECLGQMTNNQAEYTALVRALEHAARLGARHRIVLNSDSELMVKQMNGEYRVKDETLRPLYDQAQKLRRQFDSVVIRHVRRNLNAEADRLCNEALDGKRGADARPAAKAVAPKARAVAATVVPTAGLRERAVECLRTAGAAAPELVWEQLWSLLEEEGVLRKPAPRSPSPRTRVRLAVRPAR